MFDAPECVMENHRLEQVERHWLALAVRDPEPKLRKAVRMMDKLITQLQDANEVIDKMTERATALEKIIDTAETYIPNDQLCTYYESLDQV